MKTTTQNSSPESDYHTRIEQKIDAIVADLEKTKSDIHKMKQFFMWTFIVSIVTFVIPLLAAVILVPMFIGSYLDSFGGLL